MRPGVEIHETASRRHETLVPAAERAPVLSAEEEGAALGWQLEPTAARRAGED
jgi:hypothetical protein